MMCRALPRRHFPTAARASRMLGLSLVASGLAAGAAVAATQVPARAPASLAIEHQAPGCVAAGKYARVAACFKPQGALARARVYFRAGGTADWFYVEMSGPPPCLQGVLPRPKKGLERIEYYVAATDRSFAESRTRGARRPGDRRRALQRRPRRPRGRLGQRRDRLGLGRGPGGLRHRRRPLAPAHRGRGGGRRRRGGGRHRRRRGRRRDAAHDDAPADDHDDDRPHDDHDHDRHATPTTTTTTTTCRRRPPRRRQRRPRRPPRPHPAAVRDPQSAAERQHHLPVDRPPERPPGHRQRQRVRPLPGLRREGSALLLAVLPRGGVRSHRTSSAPTPRRPTAPSGSSRPAGRRPRTASASSPAPRTTAGT